jgi:hypothetical protein
MFAGRREDAPQDEGKFLVGRLRELSLESKKPTSRIDADSDIPTSKTKVG